MSQIADEMTIHYERAYLTALTALLGNEGTLLKSQSVHDYCTEIALKHVKSLGDFRKTVMGT